MTSEELAEHAAQLCEAHGVQLFVALSMQTSPPVGGASHDADGNPIIVLSAWPGDEDAYFLTLHELGHHCQVTRWGSKPRLDEEAEAWRWALDNALIEPSADIWARIAARLRTYGDDRRFKRSPTFDRLLSEAERSAA